MINFGKPVVELEKDLNNIFKEYYEDYLEKCFKGGYMTVINIKDFFNMYYRLGYENKKEISKKGKIFMYCEYEERLLEVNIIENKRVYVRKYDISNKELEKYINRTEVD